MPIIDPNQIKYQNYQKLISRGYSPQKILELTGYSPPSVQAPAIPEPSEMPQEGYVMPPGFGQNMVENMKRKWLQYGLGTIGGVVGGLAPNLIPGFAAAPEEAVTVPAGQAVGTFIGGVLGAMGGGALGETGRQLDKEYPITKRLDIDKIKAAALEEGASEALGRGIAGGISKLRAPLAHKAIPRSAEASETLRMAGERAIKGEFAEELSEDVIKKMTPKRGLFHPFTKKAKVPTIITAGQRTQAPLLDWTETAVENSIFGGNPMYILKQIGQPTAYKQFVKETQEQFWKSAGKKLSPEEIGLMFLENIDAKRQAAHAILSKGYGMLDEATKGVGVDMRNVKRIARLLAKEAEPSKGIGTSGPVRRFTNKVLSWDDFVSSFKKARRMRSDLLSERRVLESRFFGGGRNSQLRRVESILSKATDKAMENSAKKYSPEAYKMWRGLNKAYRYTEETLSSDLMQGYTKIATNPKTRRLLVKRIFQPHNVEAIKQTKQAVSKNTFETMKASFVEDIINNSQREGVFWSQTFATKLKSYGPEFLSEVFDKSQLKAIDDVVRIGNLIQKPIGRKGGSMVIQLTQSGAILTLLTGGALLGEPSLTAGGYTILLGPAALGKLFVSKQGAQLLSEGLKTSLLAKSAFPLAVRIARAAGEPVEEKRKAPEIKTRQLYPIQTKGLTKPQTIKLLQGQGSRQVPVLSK